MQNSVIIGISGASGSGKSLLASTLFNELGSEQVVVISEDSYYKNHPDLTFEERGKINYDHPDAFDHDLMIQHLKALLAGRTVEVPIYNHSQHLRSEETRPIGQHAIIVLEGILLFVEKKLRELMNIRVFMDTPMDICLLRRIKRDVIHRARTLESVLEQYETFVRPMYLQFIEPSKRYADIIVPRGGENRIAIDLIKAKMRECLVDFNHHSE
ncbi:MAG: uridine kinase [Gammaproteobacteria bacterium]|nr:uridine kinase [Gammaproteobacteria bacterium]